MTSRAAGEQDPQNTSSTGLGKKEWPPELQGGGIVSSALKYPRTWLVAAIMILFLGGTAIEKIPTDIFPPIDIPVVTVIWTYTGLSPKEVAERITTFSEFQISNTVSDIKNIESQSLNGVSIERVYFQPNVNIDLAIAQIVSITNSIRSMLPPGINPPQVFRFSASSVPVIQLSVSGKNLSEQQLYDYGIYTVRQDITSVPGATVTSPYGGKPRQIMVDIDPAKLLAIGLTPLDVVRAVNAQNLTLPSGLMKVGKTQYLVRTNATPDAVSVLNGIPVKEVNGAMVYLQDVAYVRDGNAVQQNIVRTDGSRSTLITILKSGEASTLSVVNNVKDLALPVIRAAAPKGMKIETLFDQSVFVVKSIDDVVREGTTAAFLTGLMILLFLGSWRSTLIVLVSIPLAILTSLVILYFIGDTMNVMTLGGLALAVGILVDDATVTIENTHRILGEGKGLLAATVEGAAGIAKPALVSTLAISCVFISVVFLEGPAFYLFLPQALAVVFAMLASYVLSRTLVPICINFLLGHEHHGPHDDPPKNVFSRFDRAFNHGFDRLRNNYGSLLATVLTRRYIIPIVVAVVVVLIGGVMPFVGQDYFPQVDAGQLKLHVRAPSGMRIENTEEVFQRVEDAIRQVIPDKDRGLMVDNIGLPASNTNLAYNDSSLVGLNDGYILISLKPDHAPTSLYMRKLREVLNQKFPDVVFYFQPADIMTQILNFGLPAPIDIQVIGRDTGNNLAIAEQIRSAVHGVAGAADVHLHQIVDAPELFVNVDRARAKQLGTTELDVADNLNVSLSSSWQVAPNFWTDPRTGIPYPVAVQTPEYKMDSMAALDNTALAMNTVGAKGDFFPNLLRNVASIVRGPAQTVVDHSNVLPVYDVFANVQDRDLGGVASDIEPIIAKMRAKLKPGNYIVMRGQIESMHEAFKDLGIGILFAFVFVYLLMVLTFQTWLDPFVVICGLPGAMCGIVFMLFVTGTAFSIPSLMGAVMSVGVASANSILLVTFAKEIHDSGRSPLEAALEAGIIRLRPVLMTAGAMIVGMIPMALDLGGGSEVNAALGRAVIGGVLIGTCSTLFVVPYLYSLFHRLYKGPQAQHSESTP